MDGDGGVALGLGVGFGVGFGVAVGRGVATGPQFVTPDPFAWPVDAGTWYFVVGCVPVGGKRTATSLRIAGTSGTWI